MVFPIRCMEEGRVVGRAAETVEEVTEVETESDGGHRKPERL